MNPKVIFLSIPGLRQQDVGLMPNLSQLCSAGSKSTLAHSFPCVTWPSQANVLTGKRPRDHGVVANGFYWRESQKVEMWTAWNEVIQSPQIWDVLKQRNDQLKTAAWFPMLSKGCGADFVCMPAPIHQPDGSEDLWCYTKPQEFYGELLEQLDHFPLQHFWGPLANIQSTKWIADSAVRAASQFHPDFFYIYFPHLDYAAQKTGPDSEPAKTAVSDLDKLIKEFAGQMQDCYDSELIWIVASEYTIGKVDHVTYPNRLLREQGLLQVQETESGEQLDFQNSAAWALVDHQFAHVFVKEPHEANVRAIESVFTGIEGIEFVLSGNEREKFGMSHERSGEIILISTPNSWQAYYWWLDDSKAPAFANQVDIHRKPGYDPIELHFDFASKSVPLNAELAKGSHGAPAVSDDQKGLLLCSRDLHLSEEIKDTEIFDLVLNLFD